MRANPPRPQHRLTSRFLAVAGTVAIVASLPGLASASDPASSDVTASSAPGTVTAEWTGLIPPGAGNSSCADVGAVSDSHTIEMTISPEAAAMELTASFFLTYDGPTVDAIVSVELPDGTVVDGDGGFVQTNESITLSNLTSGTYTYYACMYAGVTPQAYDGRLELVTREIRPQVASGPTCDVTTTQPKFESAYIDETRAGGEPMITRHPDGTLLWGSHAGTTHFYGPAAPDPTTAAFLQNYEGQTYQYWSDDDGATWNFADRTPINGDINAPGSGFSDPEFAIDAAGNVFASEINLANVAVSKSSDSGRTWTLQNLTAFTLTDRQWNAADAEDVVYMSGNAIFGGTLPGVPAGTSGHILTKSTDGGVNWSQPEVANPSGNGDIQVDPSDGSLYELTYNGGVLSMGVYRDIRDQSSGFGAGLKTYPIASGTGMTGVSQQIGPTFDLDADGNLYVVWEENGLGVRPQGIYYSYSTDRGESWVVPIRVDTTTDTNVWPWIAVDDAGEVAIAYLEIGVELANSDSSIAPDDEGWSVIVAHTANGLGCGDSSIPGFTHTNASGDPVHFGTICNGGTICQAQAVDRRLGDYFSNEFDRNGRVVVAVSDTISGGSISLPRILRQVSGGEPVTVTPPAPSPEPAPAPLPTTGGGLAVLGLGLLAAAGAARRR